MASLDGSSDRPAEYSTTSASTVTAQVLADTATLVFHVDLLIVAFIACFVLFRLPRALARLSRAMAWTHGHLLRSISRSRLHVDREKRHASRYSIGGILSERGMDFNSNDSHSLYTREYITQRHKRRRHANYLYPPHVSACPAFCRPLVPILRYRIRPGFSLGRLLVLGGYLIVLVFVAFDNSNPFADPARSGFIATSQLPIVFAFAAKNSVTGIPLCLSYEKLNYFHRFAGRLLVLAVNVHTLYYVYKYTIAGTFSASLYVPSNAWGYTGLICLDAIFFFSTSFWRQKAYNVFISTHVLSFCILLPAIYYHKAVTLYYVLAAAFVYAIDLCMRVLKTRIFQARIQPLPELAMTRIEIPRLNSGWRAGQHVRIRVLSSAMGWFGWAELHPFTIASMSDTQEGLVLMCKKAGGWTSKLYEIAKARGYREGGHSSGKNITLMIEGPYGGPGPAMFASYSAAVFVVGGSGITFALSTVQELVQRDLERSSRVKVIEFIWCVQDHASLNPVLPLFTSLIEKSTITPLRISVFYTRATIDPVQKQNYIAGLTLSPSRPRFGKVLDAVISRAVSLGSGAKDSEAITGVIVGVCGPLSLGDEVAKAIAGVDVRRREAVGGIELHEEVFDW